MPDQLVEVEGRRLKLTNPNKVLYPEDGFTKGDVIRYYSRVSARDVCRVALTLHNALADIGLHTLVKSTGSFARVDAAMTPAGWSGGRWVGARHDRHQLQVGGQVTRRRSQREQSHVHARDRP
jgi:hypothetical protein